MDLASRTPTLAALVDGMWASAIDSFTRQTYSVCNMKTEEILHLVRFLPAGGSLLFRLVHQVIDDDLHGQ